MKAALVPTLLVHSEFIRVKHITASKDLGAVLEPGDDSDGELLSPSDAGMLHDEESELVRALRGEKSDRDGKFSSEEEEE